MNNDCFFSMLLLENEIKELKQKEQTEDVQKLTSYCERELEMMSHITRNGVSMLGCSIEEFKEKLREKPNVLLLSDEEVQQYEKAIKIIKLVSSI